MTLPLGFRTRLGVWALARRAAWAEVWACAEHSLYRSYPGETTLGGLTELSNVGKDARNGTKLAFSRSRVA